MTFKCGETIKFLECTMNSIAAILIEVLAKNVKGANFLLGISSKGTGKLNGLGHAYFSSVNKNFSDIVA